MNDGPLTEHTLTGGGLAGMHLPLREPEALLAPATPEEESRHNTLKLSLTPFACWRADDLRFHFESSFVVPELKSEMKALKKLLDENTLDDEAGEPKHRPALTVFGHADPVGNDDYNKALSGRRAAAIYALLTRRDDIWEDLFSSTGKFASPAAGDKWGLVAVQAMLASTGFPTGDSGGKMDDRTRQAVKDFQAANGLTNDGDPGPKTRQKLFRAYMDRICVQGGFKITAQVLERLRAASLPESLPSELEVLKDRFFDRESDFIAAVKGSVSRAEPQQVELVVAEAEFDQPYTVESTDFLAKGGDATGKGDYQGCSEFNPVLLFSSAEKQEFEKAKDKTARNAANAPNRRVLILLFRPGVTVAPDKWPCPRAKEGVAGCKKRFWSDGEQRRTNGEQMREFTDTQDTFACRFYHRFVTRSPCEAALATVQIRLFDRQARPLPFAPCVVKSPGQKPRPDRASGRTPAASPSADDGSPDDAFVTVQDLTPSPRQKLPDPAVVPGRRPGNGVRPPAR
jgi:outer membrane protein OmpA-like peptidoglycan-associated protein